MKDTPNYLTAICPVYNEEDNIRNVLDFFISARPSEKDLFIVDGNSGDGTCDIVRKYEAMYPNIKLLQNPRRTVPFALNIALRESCGDPVVRLDAHTTYASDYFEKILETFHDSGADIVGGPMRPIGKTKTQKAIGLASMSPFGIGNSKFHDITYKGYVDSVYLGAWRRSIFDDIGYFDERLKRNQDDEFHYRAGSKGKKIFLNPEIRSEYFPRSSYGALFLQYFQYGLYKPLVLKKIKSGAKIRHLIPAFFVLYLLFLIPGLFLLGFYSLFPLFLYVLSALYFSFRSECQFLIRIRIFFAYICIHTAYGFGFLAGIFKC
jgi:succinoglycan biosynthesis protein ExoA